MQIPTTDQLRARIESGQTGEKVAMPDPATVPLGTDAEAGGHAASPADRALEARKSPRAPATRSKPPGAVLYGIAIVVLALVIVVVVISALPN